MHEFAVDLFLENPGTRRRSAGRSSAIRRPRVRCRGRHRSHRRCRAALCAVLIVIIVVPVVVVVMVESVITTFISSTLASVRQAFLCLGLRGLLGCPQRAAVRHGPGRVAVSSTACPSLFVSYLPCCRAEKRSRKKGSRRSFCCYVRALRFPLRGSDV